MATVTKTINDSIDEAVERLPFLRRRITKRHFRRNPESKEEVADRLMLAMSQNEEIQAMGLATGFASGAIRADTPFSIDLENLERFLQIIIEYLPKILEIVLQIIPLFTSVLLLVCGSLLLSAGQVQAQEVCQGGVCKITSAPEYSSESPEIGSHPVSAPVLTVVRATAAVATRPVAELARRRPVRTLVANRKPLRTLVRAQPVRRILRRLQCR